MGVKEIIFGTFIWLIIFLVTAIPLTFLLIWKVVVILIVKCTRRDLLLPKALDIMNAPGNGEEYSVVNFGLVCRIDGEVNLDDLQTRFTEKFLAPEDGYPNKQRYERLHCALVSFCGYAFFKKVHQLDINEQIYIKNLREGQLLEDLLSEWILTKYRPDSPCWEVIVIPTGATNQSQTAVAMKIHHAIADGYSMLYILDQLTDMESPYLVKDFKETLGEKISQMLALPCHLGKLKGDPQSNPFPCVKEDPYRWKMCFTRLDLNLLKQIRRKHNVHFGSIVMSLLGGTLRRYLLETKGPLELPSFLSMGTTLPWPRHPSKIPESSTNEKICNHWVTGLVRVPISEDNPVQRLMDVESSLTEFQELGVDKFMGRVMIPLMRIIPIFGLRKAFSKDPGFTAGYSTTVGGDNYKLFGKLIAHIHPILAIHDANPYIPISTFSFSHSNHFELTFSVNPLHFPDRASMNRIVDQYLTHELRRLSILSGIVSNIKPESE